MEEQEESGIDVLPLLRYLVETPPTAKRATAVIVDICREDDLPQIFHELCSHYLLQRSWTTRLNTGYLLGKLTSKLKGSLLDLATSGGENIYCLCISVFITDI